MEGCELGSISLRVDVLFWWVLGGVSAHGSCPLPQTLSLNPNLTPLALKKEPHNIAEHQKAPWGVVVNLGYPPLNHPFLKKGLGV